MWFSFAGLYLGTAISVVTGLQNGVGLTPVMGWMTWQRYRCNVDCVNDPDNCISANLVKTHADRLVSLGLTTLGYTYVNIDSCWSSMSRDVSGNLVANETRFPGGIREVADYVHSKGLKLGLYSNMGPKMGDGSPGLNCNSSNCEQARRDINTMVSWGIDSLKVDGDFGADSIAMNESYPTVGGYLATASNRTGRPVVFECSWPAYTARQYPVQYRLMSKHCNMWRNYHDIQDNVDSLWDIANYWATTFDSREGRATGLPLVEFRNTGPGHFNDPDMLLIGQTPCPHSCQPPECPRGMHCGNLTEAEERTQFALWSIWASPLLMSNDLRTIPQHSVELLSNAEVIRVNQDRLGRQGKRVAYSAEFNTEIWSRDLDNGDVAIVARNVGKTSAVRITVPLWLCGFTNATQVDLRDILNHNNLGVHSVEYSLLVDPHDVAMFRVSVQN